MEHSHDILQRYVYDPDQAQARQFIATGSAVKAEQARLQNFAPIIERLDALPSPSFAAMRPDLEALLASDDLRRYLDIEIAYSQQCEIHRPAAATIDNDVMQGLQVIDREHFAVTVIVTNPTAAAYKKQRNRDVATSIMMSPYDMVVRFLTDGGRISVYSCDAIDDSNPASRELSCQKTAEMEVRAGDTLVLRAGRDSFAFDSVDRAVCFAQAYCKSSHACVMPEFDTASRKLIGVSAGHDKSSRIQLMSSLVRIFGHAEGFSALEPFTAHSDYFVRWYVARELVVIDAQRALPIIERLAACDPHPQVRGAALLTLQLLTRQAA